MADTHIHPTQVCLVDNFPGVPEAKTLPRASIILSGAGQNAAAAAHPLGSKIQVRQSGTYGPAGLSTLMYGKLEEDDATNKVVAAGIVCTVSGETRVEPHLLSSDEADIGTYASGMVAVAISAMTENYFGWFWIGGVAPADQVVAFRSDTTDLPCLDEITIGCAMILVAVTGAVTGNIGFGITTATTVLRTCGVALVADHAA